MTIGRYNVMKVTKIVSSLSALPGRDRDPSRTSGRGSNPKRHEASSNRGNLLRQMVRHIHQAQKTEIFIPRMLGDFGPAPDAGELADGLEAKFPILAAAPVSVDGRSGYFPMGDKPPSTIHPEHEPMAHGEAHLPCWRQPERAKSMGTAALNQPYNRDKAG